MGPSGPLYLTKLLKSLGLGKALTFTSGRGRGGDLQILKLMGGTGVGKGR